MKTVKVTYTTQADYAARNSSNIAQVMADLQAIGSMGIKYSAYLCPDGKTFVHIASFRSEDDQKTLFDLPSFKSFQEQLKASAPEAPPKNELLTLIGSSQHIHNN